MNNNLPELSWREKKRRIEAWYGYVYLLKCGEYYKIGYSKKPYRRAKKLRTATPYPIEVVFTLRTPHYKHAEKTLHYRYRDKRRNGEWFELSVDDVAEIMSIDSVGRPPIERAQDTAYALAYKATGDRVAAAEAMSICRESYAGGCL